jgi:hypothetical protein
MAFRLSAALRLPIIFCALPLALGAEPAPEICDVAASLDPASGAVVTWSGGTAPFLIVRGNAARFDRASELKYIERIREHRYVDSSVREPEPRYYYQVYDNFSARELFSGPEHSHDTGDEREPGDDDEKPPDNNYCKGVLRRPATWK